MGSQLFGPRPDHGEKPIPTKHERDEYHDFLEIFMASEIFDTLPEETQQAVAVCRDTLCWTLGHENEAFTINMTSWSDYYKDYFGFKDSYKN